MLKNNFLKMVEIFNILIFEISNNRDIILLN